MQSDDETLAEDPYRALVAASYHDDDAAKHLLGDVIANGAPRARVLALRGAARHELLSDHAWRALLSDDEVIVRREVARLLAYRAPLADGLADALVEALGDDDPLVVERAAFALGEHACVVALDALRDTGANHDDPRCRESAVAALGAIGDERALTTVIAALEDKAPIRRRAIVALSNFEGPEVDAALARAGEDRDWQVRAAVSQLGRHENDD
ncbi:MAG: HEAT repeat domain-containing protein [Acidobacteriota bacterium]|nr:HEAT repeat domain-containing protein [Acidobacteriota bacterium]MDE3043275.1 HEAT repeat domain-containing protein [Acidobacteriota bacterium]MDE3107453.1 HEAT repeat domain-containing protein [Acidobacteriota bacterium]MDE3222721.1 HEAT repeat domain-containing protein [Acidobacteriota bacterium]